MTDYFWPPDIIPSAAEWRVLDSSGVFTSPLSGAVRTVSRPGTRLGCVLHFENLKADPRYRLMGLAAALRGKANRIWIADVSTPLRGSFPASELISNISFPNTTGWTVSGAEMAIAAASGRMRMTRNAATASSFAYAQLTTVTSAQYLFRAGLIGGRGAPNYNVRLGSSTTGSELGSSGAQTSAAYKHAVGQAAGTTSYANIQDIHTGKAADYFQSLQMPSAARCALVNGGSQVGSALQIDQLPNSTNGLAVDGDLVSIFTTQWEMKRVVQDLNSNGSGQGTLIFEPACRVSPPDNSPIAFYQPTARFLLDSESFDWDARPGLFSNFSIPFIEDVT